MVNPGFDAEPELLRHGEALRALAAALLGRGADADDAVQETWRRALQSPPRHAQRVGGWLATILHNVARRMRRAAVRRKRHELVARGRTTLLAEDAATAHARAELVHRLVAAVEALDAPYREVVWQRFFAGREPREIAAASGEPLGTVKSRLQRGLEMLRTRLGEREDIDWRAGLAGAFGLDGGGAVAATAIVGGAWMATWWKGAAVAAGLVAVLLPWPRVANPLRDAGADNAAAAALAASANVVVANGATDDADGVARGDAPAPARTPAAFAPPPRAQELATMRGRAVDEHGQPLAGVEFSVGARVDHARALQLGLDPAAEPAWVKPAPCTTEADGRFVSTFATAPELTFRCALTDEGRVWLAGAWSEIPPGAQIDAGDVVIPVGTRLAGRVVDANGNGVARANLELRRAGELAMLRASEPPHRFVPQRPYARATDAAGRFVFEHALPAGDWELGASNQPGAAPAQTLVVAGAGDQDVELAWTWHPADHAITLHVTDEAGTPVESARVAVLPPARGMPSSTSRAGHCTLQRLGTDPATPASLIVRAFGYDVLRTEPIAWGARDVELRLVRGAPVDVAVVDEHGQPVRDFTVRVLPREEVGASSSRDGDVRARGPFVDGVAHVAAVGAGAWHVLVEFPRDSGRQPTFVALDMAPRSARQWLRVRAPLPTQRLLRVRTANGAPVAGTSVQLLDPVFAPAHPAFPEQAMAAAVALQNRASSILVDGGVTDERGELRLRGPAERALALRLLGPGHVPLRVPDVSFASDAELVVEVDAGGRIDGRIEPAALIAELRRRASEGPTASPPLQHPVTVALVADVGTARIPEHTDPDGRASHAVDDAGRFTLTGVPAGRWHVELWHRTPQLLGHATHTLRLGTVDVRADATTSFVGDARELVPGTLRGLALANGAPLANTLLTLEGTAAGAPTIQPLVVSATTDAAGRFEVRARAGTWRARTTLHRGPVPWPATGAAVVAAGATGESTFVFAGGRLALHVLDAAGRPARQLVVQCELVGAERALGELTTDDAGAFSSDLPAGTWRLRVRPRRLQAQPALHALLAEPGGAERLAAAMLDLGTVAIAASATPTAVTLQLPAAWNRP